MTLRMGDGPVANLPPGLDAYAGYDDFSGIGETWSAVRGIPARFHMSISTVAGVPADCGDVESGALNRWTGYKVGYCAIANAESLIASFGRPYRLWTAHHNDVPHICGPQCGFGFTGLADGTQWTNHGGAWDESLLIGTFFDFQASPPTPIGVPKMGLYVLAPTQAGDPTVGVIDGTPMREVTDVAGWEAKGALVLPADHQTITDAVAHIPVPGNNT